jgi:glycosyltransferase involved in cell wall biosynthesis
MTLPNGVRLEVVSPGSPATPTRHVLMTVDAVGGVWRYALDLAAQLRAHGYRFTLVGLGPQPSPAQRQEAERVADVVWLDAPLDWLVEDERALDAVPPLLAPLVASLDVDLVHLNLPSQAAGLVVDVPVLVVSHSCVVTWFAGVRGSEVPPDWAWQKRRNLAGFSNSDMVLAPSRSHADMLRAAYGPLANQRVVYNGSRAIPGSTDKEPFVFAAGRWWDDGKNGATLDAASRAMEWPVVMAGNNRGPAGQYVAIEHADLRGELPHAEVRALMGRAAIVCSPSVYEPFGLAPLEAAGARAALVLSDIPTYRELWDGAALFAPPHDAAGMAAAVNTLARDPGRRAELAEKAQQRAQQYSLAAQAEAMAGAYADLLNTPSIAQRA